MRVLVSLVLLLAAMDLCLCQILGRILSYDDIFDALESKAKDKERGDQDHNHPHHSGHDSNGHHHHHHHHKHHHDSPHHHHGKHNKPRHHVTKDRHTSASIRKSNEELFATKDQLALVRELNEKIDRDFHKQFHSKPYPLQLSGSEPVLCKSSHIASNQLFSDHSHNLMDSQSSAPNMMAKNFDFPYDPSKYQKDFNSILLSEHHNNKNLMFDRKPIVLDVSDIDFTPDQSLNSDVFARDFAYNVNQNTFRKYDTRPHKKAPSKMLTSLTPSLEDFDSYADMFARPDISMEDPYTRPDLDEEIFDKDMMDTRRSMIKQLPKRNANRATFEDFDPSELRMSKIPQSKLKFMDTVSSKLPDNIKNKFNHDVKYWDMEPDIVSKNDKKKAQKTTSEPREERKFGQTKSSSDTLKKHPDKSYETLSIGSPYPNEPSSFNSAGYLDILPASKSRR